MDTDKKGVRGAEGTRKGKAETSGEARDSIMISETGSGNREQEFDRFVVDSLPVAVVTVDSNLRISGFNPWAERITGYRAGEAKGRFCGDILHGGMCGLRCPLKAVMGHREPILGMDTVIRGRTGKDIQVRMSIAGLFDSEGRLLGGVETLQDVSALKALERERSNFISMIAHDMKSPVISIHGFAHRLLKGGCAKDEQGERYLEIIEGEAAKLERLINEFLEFSRYQPGVLTLHPSATSLDKELHELHETYLQRAEERGLTLELRSDEPLSIISADTDRLRRVFTNLLDNAMKFSEDGGRITISTEETASEILVMISDEGIGIDPSDLPHVFEPFYRGHAGGKREGFGLGLAGAKAIVESHGGSIQVQSRPGEGSTFKVALPKVTDPNPQRPAP